MTEEIQPQTTSEVMVPTRAFRTMDELPMVPSDLHKHPAIYTTLDTSKPAERRKLYDMLIEGGDNASRWINKTFTPEAMVIHPVNKIDQTSGEVTQLPRVVIITTDGDRVQFASNGIWQSIMGMIAGGFKPFGDDEQAFTLIQVQTSPDRKVYKLARVKDSGAPKTKKGR